ncbi:MAG: ATP-binding protein [Proteobacteria bacterium]|nr:ATP-binding protein [Pseudomonadota bacterium]MBU4294872.1 ATP-binding protein [Pseudomonadota bacterium]
MGLAVVHGIVKSCGGIIKVTSERNHGTTFCVYLPVTDAKQVVIADAVEEILQRGNDAFCSLMMKRQSSACRKIPWPRLAIT